MLHGGCVASSLHAFLRLRALLLQIFGKCDSMEREVAERTKKALRFTRRNAITAAEGAVTRVGAALATSNAKIYLLEKLSCLAFIYCLSASTGFKTVSELATSQSFLTRSEDSSVNTEN